MNFRFRSALVVVCSTILLGCVANKPFRLLGIDDKNYHNQKPFFDEVPISDRTYRISFVEFDERGDFWDRRQLGRANHTIRRTRGKPLLLVIYIHGWHHNANSRKPGGKNPGDVETFRCLLSELAVSASTENFQVHGIYLGWRGRLVQGPLDYLTFLSRKSAATRVAGTPVTETIFELIRQARRTNSGSKCVVVGHSFGALVLEKAMAQALTGGVLAQDAQTRGRSFNAPADLILLVNSAGESIYAKEMREMFARIGHRDSINPNRPLLISITSKTDTATKGWFPIGTFLPNLFGHRQYHWDNRYGTLSQEVDQHEYLTTTPGHNKRLFSHRVDPADAPSEASSATEVARMTARIRKTQCAELEEPNPAFEENLENPHGMTFATPTKNDPSQFNWWKITRPEDAQRTPYWIMQVPKEIVDGHTPIFTPAGRAMMAALFRIANPIGEEGARQMLLAPPSGDQ